jgi:hypothetical protein
MTSRGDRGGSAVSAADLLRVPCACAHVTAFACGLHHTTRALAVIAAGLGLTAHHAWYSCKRTRKTCLPGTYALSSFILLPTGGQTRVQCASLSFIGLITCMTTVPPANPGSTTWAP